MLHEMVRPPADRDFPTCLLQFPPMPTISCSEQRGRATAVAPCRPKRLEPRVFRRLQLLGINHPSSSLYNTECLTCIRTSLGYQVASSLFSTRTCPGSRSAALAAILVSKTTTVRILSRPSVVASVDAHLAASSTAACPMLMRRAAGSVHTPLTAHRMGPFIVLVAAAIPAVPAVPSIPAMPITRLAGVSLLSASAVSL